MRPATLTCSKNCEVYIHCEKRPIKKTVVIQHDSLPHTAGVIPGQSQIRTVEFSCTNLGPSDYHLFRVLKDNIRGRECRSSPKAVSSWLRGARKYSAAAGFSSSHGPGRKAWIVLVILWKGEMTSAGTIANIRLLSCTFVSVCSKCAHDFWYDLPRVLLRTSFN
jgi:hypothetical protein